ncbi:MAG: rhodanese-like domain-containing protein [Acidimicrobiia bacterium]
MGLINRSGVPSVRPAEYRSEPADTWLLDVREPDEWAAGHAPDAHHVPLGSLESHRFDLPVNLRILCICRSGGRSAEATATLTEWGFDAYNLEGGMQSWEAEGMPVVTDEGSEGSVI